MNLRRLPLLLPFILLTAGVRAEEDGTPTSVQELTAKTRDSLVVISQIGRGGADRGLGTGFIISADGLIATCNHVIGESRELSVKLASGEVFPATAIHAWNRKLDLAILRIDPGDKKLEPLELGDSDELAEGQRVITIGNPHGLSFSVVEGIVSAIRAIEVDGPPLIQLAIPVEPGNSGGPLIDLDGKVFGMIAMKSTVTDNIGFAVPANFLKPLLEKPNSVPMKDWVTIGALDPRQWKDSMGARWRQRAGKITADSPGEGFGGRSLCISQREVPDLPYELAVKVRLDDEAGAAGLAFESDGGDVHYGFYPSAGEIRLTRFDGPDVYSWKVLRQVPTQAYRPGEWNHLRVRVGEEKITAWVNGQQVVELAEKQLRGGRAGLAKFRQTRAEFAEFRIGKDLAPPPIDPDMLASVNAQLAELDLSEERLAALAKTPDITRDLLAARRKELNQQMEQLDQLADAVHRRSISERLLAEIREKQEAEINLVRSALLIAELDNPDLDTDGYEAEFERLAERAAGAVGKVAGEREKLAALSRFLFEENGFHGSRGAYYSRSNSYLNEVMDDREGIPITLAVLFIELADRIGISGVKGLGLPGHFVVRHDLDDDDRQLIDVFDGGKFITPAEAMKLAGLIPALGESLADYPVSSKSAIIARMLTNLKGIAIEEQEPLAAVRYVDLLVALDPEQPAERLSRALLNAQAEYPERALPDLEWIFAREPEGIDLERLREFYQHLTSQLSREN